MRSGSWFIGGSGNGSRNPAEQTVYITHRFLAHNSRMIYVVLFVIGGAIYVMLELFWRGRSHVSMAIAGGVSLVLLYGV